MIYEFGGFRLDPSRRLLFGLDGEAVALKPKAFDALVYLVEHAGEVLDKTAVMTAVWNGVIVEENGLNQLVSTLRRVLGEAPGENRFIVTVPGRGYRFVAAVRQPAEQDPYSSDSLLRPPPAAHQTGPPPTRRWLDGPRLAAVAALIAVVGAGVWYLDVTDRFWGGARERSIAVLPLSDLSEGADQAWFADAISEELTTVLASMPELRVIARTSTFHFKNKDATIAEVGDALDVSYVLEGSVRRGGDQLRIVVRLVEVRTSRSVWSATYDRTIGDVFAIQRDIGARVAERLGIVLHGAAPVIDETAPEAYALYLRARHINQARIVDSLPEARAMLERAVELDPDYFPVRIALSKTYLSLSDYQLIDASEAEQLIKQALDAAEAIWPGRAELVVRRIMSGLFEGDEAAAARAVERAVAADPSNFDILNDALNTARALNRPDTMIEIGEYLIARDPLCGDCYANLMGAYLTKKQYDQVERVHRLGRALGLDMRGTYALSLVARGDPEAALAEGENVSDPVIRLGVSALAFRDLHRDADYAAANAELLELLKGTPFIVDVYAASGDLDTAFDILMAQPSVPPQRLDGMVGDWLRPHPRWPELARKAGIWPEDPRDKIAFAIDLPN